MPVLVFDRGQFDSDRSCGLGELDLETAAGAGPHGGVCLRLEGQKEFPLMVVAHLNGTGKVSTLKVGVGESCRAKILECSLGSEDGDGDSPLQWHTEMTLERGSRVDYVQAICAEASSSQNRLVANLNGEGAEARIDGLFALWGEQHCHTDSLIRHNCARTTCRQLFKGLLGDAAFGAFSGRVVVARDAQEVSSHQLSKNLLLGPKARVDTRPELEVYADNVQCAHGATVGQLSEEEIFYLQGRGIPYREALGLLCHAFANEILQLVEHPSARRWIGQIFLQHFQRNIESGVCHVT